MNQENNVSLGRLLFIAGSVLQRLVAQPPAATPAATLPGVTAAKLTALENLREAYRAADAGQHETESEKSRADLDVVTTYTAAHSGRIDLQRATDQAWTYHDLANAAIRRDFKIPPDRPASE